MSLRVGLGYDLHAVGGTAALVLGGVRIDGPGLVGHSDADVITHAVADAILGAAGLPDLGTAYPATDDRYRNVDSLTLLGDVTERVVTAGWTVENVDVVVAAETPRLAPHVAAMAAALGHVVGAPVGVKAKRGEGVGVVGRGEAIAAWAVALLTTR